MKIITVIGARPQFVKASILSREINKKKAFQEIIIHTGQHFDPNMSEVFFNEMKIPAPKYSLGIRSLAYPKMVDKMISKLLPIMKKENPDAVIVYGDTNSTLAGSLSASQLKIPIFHVESGQRSYNRIMLEEVNRLITDHISGILFCSSENSVENLRKENISSKIVHSGDIMLDAFLSNKKNIFSKNKNFSKYVLCTIHRRENTNSKKRLTKIFKNLDKINKTKKVILPLHPSTAKKIKEFNIRTNVSIIKPQGYMSFLSLLVNCDLVITDSGGVQKEAFFAKKNCITVRKETEWPELVDLKVNILSKPKNLHKTYQKNSFNSLGFKRRIYGNGKSAQKIIQSIVDYINE